MMNLLEMFPRPPGPYTRIELLRLWIAGKIVGHTAWSKLIHDLATIIPEDWRGAVYPKEWLK